ncbi:MAG: hypothetical protein JNK25_06530 [Phycisphaerae bacterium]|nr:hypothetical protein [Phycisphaerae bacterium]
MAKPSKTPTSRKSAPLTGTLPVSTQSRDTGAEPATADQAYGAALSFVESLHVLAASAREGHLGAVGQGQAGMFAQAFVAWFDLTHLLTPAIRQNARSVYQPGSPPIRIGTSRAAFSVIETIADNLGVDFRNSVYLGRPHPLEPNLSALIDQAKAGRPIGWRENLNELQQHETRASIRQRLGIESWADALTFLAKEWTSLSNEEADRARRALRFDRVEFDDLLVLLDREAKAVLSKPSSTPPFGPNEGARAPVSKPDGWTQSELVHRVRDEIGSFSNTTFTRVRIMSGVSPSEPGGRGQQRRFSRLELNALIRSVRSGTFRDKSKIAQSWTQLLG